ncbi:putative quinol monooxygenase [Nitrospirillum sp. BR 11164]|uniref:putative quinol monooxygenase n=1 Tax=Nitrospirillum sp. BR 11164 TaxID=3104324 RepID=UPI002AFE17F4|nr:putative quinol monooxygenase [Nitrospirillum sp. BR 11164]MEA1651148.1 putative quinol monooxygenase [Nitrospirillum sp. BR 11164]
MLIVMGHVQVAPSAMEEFATDIQALARSVRRREGNLSYAVAVEDPSAGRLLVAERWRDQASLSAHLDAPDTRAFVDKWQGRMAGDIRKYDAANERPLMDG